MTYRAMMCLAGGLALAVGSAAGQPARPTPEQLEQRAATLLPKPDQLRYQQIPWVHDLADALAIAREERRPVLLWGYGGRARPDNGLEGC